MPASLVRPPRVHAPGAGAVLARDLAHPRVHAQAAQDARRAASASSRKRSVGARRRARSGTAHAQARVSIVEDGRAPAGKPQHRLEAGPGAPASAASGTRGWRGPARENARTRPGRWSAEGRRVARPPRRGSGSPARPPCRTRGGPGTRVARCSAAEPCKGILSCVTVVTHKRVFVWHSARLHERPPGRRRRSAPSSTAQGPLEARQAEAAGEVGDARRCSPATVARGRPRASEGLERRWFNRVRPTPSERSAQRRHRPAGKPHHRGRRRGGHDARRVPHGIAASADGPADGRHDVDAGAHHARKAPLQVLDKPADRFRRSLKVASRKLRRTRTSSRRRPSGGYPAPDTVGVRGRHARADRLLRVGRRPDSGLG